ncbi:hypothetical protein ES705_25537 [subsurface metagenome]
MLLLVNCLKQGFSWRKMLEKNFSGEVTGMDSIFIRHIWPILISEVSYEISPWEITISDGGRACCSGVVLLLGNHPMSQILLADLRE